MITTKHASEAISEGVAYSWSAEAVFYPYTADECAVEAFAYDHIRRHDPTVGRFLSEDPIGFLFDDTNLNRYVGS